MRYAFDVQKVKVEQHEFYVIESKCIKGCVAQGDTLDEALTLFAELETECIETAKQYGIEISAEPVREEIDYSGKLSVRLPKSLHKEIADLSKEDGISINQFIINALCKSIGYYEGIKENNNNVKITQMLLNIYKTASVLRSSNVIETEKYSDYSLKKRLNGGIQYVS